MKEKLIYKDRFIMEDGGIVELILWQLPKKSADRPHGIKYRLYYGDSNGQCIVRYNNEAGKGDHKHVGEQEIKYRFKDKDTLIKDFLSDVYKHRSETDD